MTTQQEFTEADYAQARELFHAHFKAYADKQRIFALHRFKQGAWRLLEQKYHRWISVTRKEKVLIKADDPATVPELQAALTKLMKELPKNACMPIVEGIACNQEGAFGGCYAEVVAYWKEYGMVHESESAKFALWRAREVLWKMKHQPNGKDGKAAIALYEKLKKDKSIEGERQGRVPC